MTYQVLCVCCVFILGVFGCGDDDVGGEQGGGAFPCTEAGVRAAVAAGGGPHAFLCNGPTTVVTEAVIEIENDVVLDGGDVLTIDGGGDHRVFLIGPFSGSVAEPWNVEFRNLRISGGFEESVDLGDGVRSNGSGGAVLSYSDLTIRNCTISDSRASQGAAISVGGGSLTILESTIADNEGFWAIDHQGAEMSIESSRISGNAGGGIYFGGTLGSIVDCTVSSNEAFEGNDGGGIVNAGDLLVSGTTISGNQAERGGGISNSGNLFIGLSTVSGNGAVEGGGIFNLDPFRPDMPVVGVGVLQIVHSTLSGNTAERGGGIYTAGLWQRIENSTISGNSTQEGGGIAMIGTEEGPSSLTLANVTIAANAAPEGSGIWAAGESPEIRFVGNIVEGSCQGGEGTVT